MEKTMLKKMMKEFEEVKEEYNGCLNKWDRVRKGLEDMTTLDATELLRRINELREVKNELFERLLDNKTFRNKVEREQRKAEDYYCKKFDC